MIEAFVAQDGVAATACMVAWGAAVVPIGAIKANLLECDDAIYLAHDAKTSCIKRTHGSTALEALVDIHHPSQLRTDTWKKIAD